LLIDTYDTVAAAKRLAEKVKAGQMEIKGVRLDSGDLAELSKQVRSLLPPQVAILASGDIDEAEIARLKAANAPIDGYGVGTKLVSGTPFNGVYKLVEIDGIPVMKKSSSKLTYPGRKQVYRILEDGKMKCDRLQLMDEGDKNGGESVSLLQLVMKSGRRVKEPETPAEIADRTAASVASLPPHSRRPEDPELPGFETSEALETLRKQVSQRY
jgi:nicotinate phosphoribosyltransferase